MNKNVENARKIARGGSLVQPFNEQNQIYKGFQVWSDCAPAVKDDPDLLFAKCLVLPQSTKDKLILKQMEPEDASSKTFTATPQNVFNCNQNIDPMTFPDIGMIPHTNPAAVIDFIRHRFLKGQIYTSAEPLLLIVNPFKDLQNATEAIIKQYRDSVDPSKLPPHVFLVSRTAIENLYGVQKSQTIIVSGESGAGKTEATKQIMRYFAAAKGSSIDMRVQNAVLAGNPVLEAFGNAKTIRNNNSSRFGRYMQLKVTQSGGIEYGNVKCFLLEKSRIINQSDQERSFHIFYQILKGLTAEEKEKFKFSDHYEFLNMKAANVIGIDDFKDYQETKESLFSMGISQQEFEEILRCLSAVLMLGNIQIAGENRDGIPDAAKIVNINEFQNFCALLQLNVTDCADALLIKKTSAGDNKEIKGVYTQAESFVLRNSLAKAIYSNLFEWIINKLNSNIQAPQEMNHYIGLLDIFGFEVFENNSLEQLFINITNEMLQKNFVDIVFEKEQNLYRAEGISTADLVWTTNSPILSLLIDRKSSIISLLEDVCTSPAAEDKKFVSICQQQLKDNKYYASAKISSDKNFIVTHTIGDIQYCATGFLDKNKDLLKPELVQVLKNANLSVCKEAFKDTKVIKGKIGKDQLISATFINQLKELMNLINSTEPHFIRCLKPNEEKAALKYVPSKVLIQLHALSILEALQLRNLGYSYRRKFEEFRHQYKFLDLGVSEDKSINDCKAAEIILKGTGLPESEYKIGKTMVFIKHDAVKTITKYQRQMLSIWSPLISLLECMFKVYKYRKNLQSSLPGLIRLQAHIRASLYRSEKI